MGKEIERKFLVLGSAYKGLAQGVNYCQGYLSDTPERVVRIRVAGNKGFITIKGVAVGIVRAEFEYEIPQADAQQMLTTLCKKPLIEKVRYTINIAGQTWEVDEFNGDNAGLVIAEIELESEDQPLYLPDWVGAEVSHDPRYFNSNLYQNPFQNWK